MQRRSPRATRSSVRAPKRKALKLLRARTPARRRGAPYKTNVEYLQWLDSRFEEFVAYAESVKSQSSISILWYRQVYRNFRSFLAQFTSQSSAQFRLRILAIEDWARWNRERGISPITLNSYWRGLRAFFNDWEQRDGASNPFKLVPAPKLPSRIPKALSVPECVRILDAAQNYPWRTQFERARAVALVGIMLYAGLRRGEVLRLRFTEVNLSEGVIRISQGKGRYGGKDRVAYIPRDLEVILRVYLKERARKKFVNPEFFSSIRGAALPQMTLRTDLGRIQRSAGIPFSPHVLRHSFVTNMLRCGVPIQVAKELAGHADIEMTMWYTRVFDEDKRFHARKIRY